MWRRGVAELSELTCPHALTHSLTRIPVRNFFIIKTSFHDSFVPRRVFVSLG